MASYIPVRRPTRENVFTYLDNSEEVLSAQNVEDSSRYELSSESDSFGNSIIQDQYSSYTVPENRITLTWSNITANVRVSTTTKSGFSFSRKKGDAEEIEKPILRNIYGIAKPGSILAVIGSSGSGKSTLLNLLMGRVNRSFKVGGRVKANGATIGREISKFSAYLQQDDVFHPSLTVGEHLWFHAKLRLPDDRYSDRDRHEKIRTVLLELGLAKCFHLLIGGPSGGNYNEKTLSGGERKRLAFATEVLTNPSVLFCDEPTTGVDSFMAEQIVLSMKRLAERGKSIVCTLHQPSSQIIDMLDELLILSEGRVVFHGPASQVSDYFASIGHECPESFNPFDHVISVLSSRDIRIEKPHDCKEDNFQMTDYQIDKLNLNKILIDKADAMAEIFRRTKHYQGLRHEIKTASRNDHRTVLIQQKLEAGLETASPWTQFKMNIWRSFKMTIRDRRMFMARIISSLFFASVYSLLFTHQPYNQKGAINLLGLLYQLSSLFVWENIEPFAVSLPREMPVFMREQHSNMYSPGSFFLGRIVVEVPQIFIHSAILITIVYWSSNLYPSSDKYFLAVLINCSGGWVSSGLGYLIGFIFDHAAVSNGVRRAMGPLLSYTAGVYINLDTMPPWVSWLRFISPTYYVNELMQVNQWSDVTSLECEFVNIDGSSSSCFKDGRALLDFYGFSVHNVTRDALCLLGLLLIFRIAAFVVLFFKTRHSKDDA